MNWLKTEHSEYVEQASFLTDFFAEQYAQDGIKKGEDYKYLLTANFSETMTKGSNILS